MFKKFLQIDPLLFLSLIILLCILRMVIPYINFVFFIILVPFIFFTFFHVFKTDISEFRSLTFKIVFIIVSIPAFVFIGFIISKTYSFTYLKELLYVLLIIFLFCALFFLIRTRQDFTRFTDIFINQILKISIIISLIGLAKFCLQLLGFNIIFMKSLGTSLVTDYNFFSLFSLVGLLILCFSRAKFRKSTFIIFLTLLSLNILFSGSRRGLLLLIFFLLLLFIFGFNFKFEKKRLKLKLLFIVSAITTVLAVIIYLKLSMFRDYERKSLEFDQSKIVHFQEILTSLVSRYLTIISNNDSWDDVYIRLWGQENNNLKAVDYDKLKDISTESNLMYNGNFNWGLLFWHPNAKATTLKIIKTPYGNGVRVKRDFGDQKGWPLQYYGRNIIFYSNHIYSLEFKFKVQKGEELPFRIGFTTDSEYLTLDDSENLRIMRSDLGDGWEKGQCIYIPLKSRTNAHFFMNSQLDSTIIDFADIKLIDENYNENLAKYTDQISSNNQVVKDLLQDFDFKNFVKTNANSLIYNGKFTAGNLFWSKYADSTNLRLIETPFGHGVEVSRTDGNGGDWSLRYMGRPIIYYSGHKYEFSFYYKVVKGNELPFNIGWWVNEGNGYWEVAALPLTTKIKYSGWKEAKCSYRFRSTQKDLPAFLNSLQDYSTVDIADIALIDLDRNDSLPFFVDQIKNDSLINNGLSNNSDTSDNAVLLKNNKLFSDRTNLWIYSWTVFSDSLSFAQKIYGGGFDYMKMFGTKFGVGEYEYPHNPFISAFLYSGIIGGMAYIWYMFLVFYYYIKFYKYHAFYFICFLVIFYFSFFSGNTHFSIPIYAIFSIIPFLTKYLVEKEEKEETEKQIKINS